MPKKELSPPNENRKRAERLTDGKSVKNTKSRITGAIERDGEALRGSVYTESPSRQGAIEQDLEKTNGSARRAGALAAADRCLPSKSKKSAREYAMSLVAMRAYTEHGLREKLRIRGYGCDETDDAVDYLKGFGYVNDLRLAQNAAEKLAMKLNGKRKIFAYLTSKGISRDTIAELDLSEIDFKENCRTLALKFQYAGKPYEKIVASLTRAGFSSSEIYYAMKVIQ